MDPRHKDGLLAAGALVVLVGSATVTGELGAVLDPGAAVAGIAGATLIEIAFLRYPGYLLGLWERRGVPAAGLLVVLALGAAAARYAPAVVGALVWGLATYLALLGCVLVGYGNPLDTVARTGGRD